MKPNDTTATASEQGLLVAARGGDEGAFRRLVEQQHADLHAHCYRMLGSVHDAEDALQEALLRAWRGLGGFEGRSSVRSWLHRIATNTCLDAVAKRPKRVLPIDYGPPAADARADPGERLAGSVWIEPYPDEAIGVADGYAAPEARYERRESVELAFIAALQHLLPRQRAVLILREVLGFSAREVAETLDTTVASVNSSLQRARTAVDERLPERSQQATMRDLGDDRMRSIVERFVEAWDKGEVDTMVSMLTEQPTFAMPPYASWYRGSAAVEAFLPVAQGLWRLVPGRANGQLAFGAYRWNDEAGSYGPRVLDVLTLDGPRIAAVTAFGSPEIFGSFGLPDELSP
jgi:RNA polymerase sigma-70 factor (ECF subfamily)